MLKMYNITVKNEERNKDMKKIGYRVYKAYTDNYGNIVHSMLIGFAKTMKDARALHVSSGIKTPVVIEKAYSREGVKR